MPRTYTFRLTSEGVDQFVSSINRIGPEGEAAVARLKNAFPQLATAAEQAQQRAAAAQKKLVDQAKADFASLQGSVSPYIAAQQKLAEGRAVVTNAQKLGVAGDAEAAETMALLEQRYGTATKGLSGFGEGLSTVRGLLGAFGIALGVEQVVAFGKAVFDNAASLDAQARAAGTSTAALQARRAVLADSNIDAAEADALTQRLTKSIGEATGAAGSQRSAFVELGLSAKDLAGGTDAVFPKVAAALLQIQDAGQRARLESDLFGKSGQDLEAALKDLRQPTDELIAKQTALGHVMGDDLTAAADKAQREMTSSWQKLQVGLTPIVVDITQLLAGLIAEMAGIAAFPGAVLEAARAAKAGGKIAYGAPAPHTGIDTDLNIGGISSSGDVGLLPNGAPLASLVPTAADAVGAGGGFSSQSFDAYLAKSKQAADLAGLTAGERAKEEAAIGLANAMLADGNATLKDSSGQLVKQVSDYAQAKDLLDANGESQKRLLVEQQAASAEAAKAYQRLKTNYDQYLASLKESARVAGETAAQRDNELATIKAAQVVQKQRGVLEQNLVQTYSGALKVLSDTQVLEIQRAEIAKRVAAIQEQQTEQIALLNAGLAVDVDHRALAVRNAQAELAAGKGLTDEQKAQIENNNRLIQQKQDLAQFADTIAQMREEVSLAGLSADEREREAAVLQQMHAMHGDLSADQADEVRQLVAARQEAEKFGQFATSVQDDFANAFGEIGQKGKDAFGDLLSAIKREFAQLLGWMVAQAIAQPVIVPVVQSLIGSAGGVASLLGGSGGASLLGSAGQLGGLAGNSGLLGGVGSWLSSGLNNLGASLGFATSPTLVGANSALGLQGQLLSVPGTSSLFGATSLSGLLGGSLGGLGIGSLAGSLLGENSTGSSIGGLLGGALGSIVPGIGTLVGSLAGSVLGGLFGGKPSAHRATANFSDDYGITGITGTKLTAQGEQAASQAGQQIAQVVQALEAAGVTLTNNIDKLTISTARDKSFITTSSGQKIDVGPVGDVNAAVSGTLDYLLTGLTSADKAVQQVIKHYQQLGGVTAENADQFAEDVAAAKQLESISFDNTKQLSQTQQVLKEINDQFADAIAKAKSLGVDISNIVSAQKEALAALTKGYDKSIKQQLQQLNDPVAYALDQLIAAQKQRLADAKAVGADMKQVLALNKAELSNALQGYKDAVSQAQANLVQTLGGFSKDLRDYVRQIDANVLPSTPGATLSEAAAQFNEIGYAARHGDADALSKLPSAGDAYIAAAANGATTREQYALVVAQVRAQAARAADNADAQISAAQQQLDALGIVNDSVQGVSGDIKDLKKALTDAVNNLAEAEKLAAKGGTTAIAKATDKDDAAAAVKQAKKDAAANDNAAAIKRIAPVTTQPIGPGGGAGGIGGVRPGVRLYANGGDLDGGWDVVGDQGPELWFGGSGHIFSNAQSKALLDTAGMQSEMRMMREEIRQLRAELASAVNEIAKNSAAVLRILNNTSTNGDSFSISDAA